MKKKDFKDLLKSIDQARGIKSGKCKPRRVFKHKQIEVKRLRTKIKLTKEEKSIERNLHNYVTTSEKERREILKAIEEKKQDLADLAEAKKRDKDPNTKFISARELKSRLNL